MASIIKSDKNNLINYIHNENKNDLSKPFENEIYLFTTYIAGTYYIDDIFELVEELKEEDTLKLLREANNEYDERAILVLDKNNNKLGYIPMHDNEIFTRLMDAGKYIYAKVKNIIINGFNDHVSINIDLYLKD